MSIEWREARLTICLVAAISLSSGCGSGRSRSEISSPAALSSEGDEGDRGGRPGRIDWLELKDPKPAFGGKSFGAVGSYNVVIGRPRRAVAFQLTRRKSSSG